MWFSGCCQLSGWFAEILLCCMQLLYLAFRHFGLTLAFRSGLPFR